MRVALLSYNAQADDAIGNQVAEKLAFFLERGADVRVLVESGQRLHPAVRLHVLIVPTPEPRGEAWRFLSAADLVLVEYGQYYSLLEWLPLLAGGRVRVWFDYHGVTPTVLWSAHNRELIEAGARHRGLVWCADAALVHSHFTREELAQATGFPRERCGVLGHPVDLAYFVPGPASPSLRERLGLGSASVLLFVGRLAPNKRVPVLIETLARLREHKPAVHAVVVGDDGDLYQAEARRCRELAAKWGVADRLHLLGRVTIDQLRDAYHAADLLVIPSRHEGFCIPVIEAMASGLPVVAARAAALPETIGSAGLTFVPDDPDDLARQVLRVLASETANGKKENRLAGLRVAVVAFRYGKHLVGGAETSLRTIAESLQEAGHNVEVFTTCTSAENDWTNQLPEGSEILGGVAVHRFRLGAHDRQRHGESVRSILENDGRVTPNVERDYLEHSIHSRGLLEGLRTRQAEFDAVVVGPYLFGLTLDVARALPEKTLLVPCFHDEPLARLAAWTEYEQVGGILYHSPEEQALAENQLGLNHPGGTCIGAVIDTTTAGNSAAGQYLFPDCGPYVIYCGRFSAQKGLPLLLEHGRRYHERHPTRFAFVFVGQGEVPIPKYAGFRNVGFVEETARRDLVAGAAALVQLSPYESLSYAALEAWAQGTPVIVDRRCEVLTGHLSRCQGGCAVGSFEEFAQALDELWEQPAKWQDRGRRGRVYVQERYSSRRQLTDRLVMAVRALAIPLAERMRSRGLARAAQHDRARWREQFASLVENLLDNGGRAYEPQVTVKPRSLRRKVPCGSPEVLMSVRVTNRGSHAVTATGPGRTVVRWRILGANDPAAITCGNTDLPGLVMPGRAVTAAVRVTVPAAAGIYRLGFQAAPAWENGPEGSPSADHFPEAWVDLVVEPRGAAGGESCCTPFLNAIQGALADASRCQDLPTDYIDVTEGILAAWKRRIKRKLLYNFKHAYVDVLSRQQSAFNRSMLTALEELAGCCATLDHALAEGGARSAECGLCRELAQRLADSEERSAGLEKRLARLEAGVASCDTLASREA